MIDKINKRINEINASFDKKKKNADEKLAKDPSAQPAVFKFLNRFQKKEADTLYKHIPDYAKAKRSGSDEDYVVNVGVWQEFLVREWFDNFRLNDIAPTAREKDIFKQGRSNITFAEQQDKCAENNESEEKKSEKLQCKHLVTHQNDILGKLLDFQVPLKANRKESKGELDLVARQGNEMVLIEYKIPDSTEPLLRAVLEAITYFHQIDGFNPESKYLLSFNTTFFDKEDKSTWCNAIGLAIVVPKDAYVFGHKLAFELIEKYNIKCYEFQDDKNFENFKLLSKSEIAYYRNQAEENLQGIYQNSELIISKIKLI